MLKWHQHQLKSLASFLKIFPRISPSQHPSSTLVSGWPQLQFTEYSHSQPICRWNNQIQFPFISCASWNAVDFIHRRLRGNSLKSEIGIFRRNAEHGLLWLNWMKRKNNNKKKTRLKEIIRFSHSFRTYALCFSMVWHEKDFWNNIHFVN